MELVGRSCDKNIRVLIYENGNRDTELLYKFVDNPRDKYHKAKIYHNRSKGPYIRVKGKRLGLEKIIYTNA